MRKRYVIQRETKGLMDGDRCIQYWNKEKWVSDYIPVLSGDYPEHDLIRARAGDENVALIYVEIKKCEDR